MLLQPSCPPACVAHRDEPKRALLRIAHAAPTVDPASPPPQLTLRLSPRIELLSVRKRADVVIPDEVPDFDGAGALLRHGGVLHDDVV